MLCCSRFQITQYLQGILELQWDQGEGIMARCHTKKAIHYDDYKKSLSHIFWAMTEGSIKNYYTSLRRLHIHNEMGVDTPMEIQPWCRCAVVGKHFGAKSNNFNTIFTTSSSVAIAPLSGCIYFNWESSKNERYRIDYLERSKAHTKPKGKLKGQIQSCWMLTKYSQSSGRNLSKSRQQLTLTFNSTSTQAITNWRYQLELKKSVVVLQDNQKGAQVLNLLSTLEIVEFLSNVPTCLSS